MKSLLTKKFRGEIERHETVAATNGVTSETTAVEEVANAELHWDEI